MMHRPQRLIATSLCIWSLLVTAAMATPAAAQDPGANDLRDIRLGKPATDLPDAGYVNLVCASDSRKTLTDEADVNRRFTCDCALFGNAYPPS